MITARQVADWIQSLPPEFRDAPFEAQVGSLPATPKRLVAYTAKEGGHRGVCVNPMGTHLPFDDSLEWEFVLNEPLRREAQHPGPLPSPDAPLGQPPACSATLTRHAVQVAPRSETPATGHDADRQTR